MAASRPAARSAERESGEESRSRHRVTKTRSEGPAGRCDRCEGTGRGPRDLRRWTIVVVRPTSMSSTRRYHYQRCHALVDGSRVGALEAIPRNRVRSAGRRNSIAGTLLGVKGVPCPTTPSTDLASCAHADGRDGLREVPQEPHKRAFRPCLGGGLELLCGIFDDRMVARHRLVSPKRTKCTTFDD